MAIVYVGGQTGGRAGSTSTANVNYALTGGVGSAPIEGDLILINVTVGSQARTPACAITAPSTNGAWSQLAQLNANGTTYDTSMRPSYKFQAAALDTLFTLPSTGNVADAQGYTVQVWRNVDPSIFDVTSVGITGTGTGRPDPGAITPLTAGAVVIILGGGAAATGAAFVAPANYTTNFLTGNTADTNDATIGAGYRLDWTSGAEDPATFTGGSTNAANSWCAYTIVLKPAAAPADGTMLQTGSNLYGTDYASIASTPDVTVGIFISCWTKAIRPPGTPWTKANDYPVTVIGTNWVVECVSANANSTTGGYNANTMLVGNATYVGDYTFFPESGANQDHVPEAQMLDDVWLAWQIIMNGTADIILRQWIKFGVCGDLHLTESTVTVASVRTAIGDALWTPGAGSSLRFGYYGGAQQPMNLARINVQQLGGLPTNAVLHAISNNDAADITAWGDYAFAFASGVADLTDRSGNARHLTNAGYMGVGDAPPVTSGIIPIQTPVLSRANPDTVPTMATLGGILSVTFETTPTVGNLLVVEGSCENGGTLSVSDSSSNSWTIVQNAPASGNIAFVAYCIPSAASGTFVVTVSGMGSTSGKIKASEWDGNDASQPDWSVYPNTETAGLTLTSGSTDSVDGMLAISSAINVNNYETVYAPADMITLEYDSFSGRTARRITATAATETAVWPAPSAGNLAAVMVGFKPGSGSGAQTISVGQATETNLAQMIAVLVGALVISLGQVTETDVAQVITPYTSNVVTVGQVIETDVAQPITVLTGGVSIPVGQVTETNTAQPITAVAGGRVIGVGQSTETDTAQPITALVSGVTVAVGQALETDTAQTITVNSGATPQNVSVGQATETDLAQSITAYSNTIIPVGQVTETDVAQAITFAGAFNIPVDQVIETDSAQPITVLYGGVNIAVRQVNEVDTAQTITVLTGGQFITVGQVTETDLAQSIAILYGGVTVAVGQATEIDQTFTITPLAGTFGDTYNAVAYFSTSGTVTISLYDPITGTAISLSSNACSEINATGLYIWGSTKLTTQPSGYQEYAWKMTNGTTYAGGILIMGLTATDIAAAVLVAIDAAIMSDGLTYAQTKLVNDAILHGKVTGAGTSTESFWSVNQASVLVERVRITVDASGNRTAVQFINVAP